MSDHKRAAAGALVGSLLQLGVQQTLRDRGIDYGAGAAFVPSTIVRGFGYLELASEPKPENIPVVQSVVAATIAEILGNKFSDDTLARAREPLASVYETNQKANSYWLYALSDSQSQPAVLDQIRAQVADIRSVTRADIVAVAKDIFREDRKIELRIVHK